MCKDCNYLDALDLADAVLEALPEFKTRKREWVEDIRAWIVEKRHVTEKMRDGLEENLDRTWTTGEGKRASSSQGRTETTEESSSVAQETQVKPTTIRVLLCPHKDEAPVRCRAVVDLLISKSRKRATAKNLPAPDLRVIDANALDWKEIRANEGGYEGGYTWAARNFDACVLLCATAFFLGRGQYTTAECFLSRGKSVFAVRGDSLGSETERVESVERYDGEWKTTYGIAKVKARETKATGESSGESSWSFDTARRTGTNCSVCYTPQVESLSGVTCKNGHGGATPLNVSDI